MLDQILENVPRKRGDEPIAGLTIKGDRGMFPASAGMNRIFTGLLILALAMFPASAGMNRETWPGFMTAATCSPQARG